MTMFDKYEDEYDTDPYKVSDEERTMTDEQKYPPVLRSNSNGVLCLPDCYKKSRRK